MSPKERPAVRKLFSPHQIKASYVLEERLSNGDLQKCRETWFSSSCRMQLLGGPEVV